MTMLAGRIGVAVMTSSLEISTGAFRAFLSVANLNMTRMKLAFASEKKYDFALIRSDGTELWRWSDGKAFLPNEVSEVIEPQKFLTYDVDIEVPKPSEPLKSGERVVLVGVLNCVNMPYRGELSLTVL